MAYRTPATIATLDKAIAALKKLQAQLETDVDNARSPHDRTFAVGSVSGVKAAQTEIYALMNEWYRTH